MGFPHFPLFTTQFYAQEAHRGTHWSIITRVALICLFIDATYGLIVGVTLELKRDLSQGLSNYLRFNWFFGIYRTLRRDHGNTMGGHWRRVVADSFGGDQDQDRGRRCARLEEGGAWDHRHPWQWHIRQCGDQTDSGLESPSCHHVHLQHSVPGSGVEKVEIHCHYIELPTVADLA